MDLNDGSRVKLEDIPIFVFVFSCMWSSAGADGVATVNAGAVGIATGSAGAVGIATGSAGAVGVATGSAGAVGVDTVNAGAVGVATGSAGAVGVATVNAGAVGVDTVNAGAVEEAAAYVTHQRDHVVEKNNYVRQRIVFDMKPGIHPAEHPVNVWKERENSDG